MSLHSPLFDKSRPVRTTADAMPLLSDPRLLPIVAMLALGWLVGCDTGRKTEDIPASGQTQASPAEGETAAQHLPGEETGKEIGRPGGRLRMAVTAEPRTLNPVTAVAGPSLFVLEQLHADLVHFHPQEFRVEPVLAERFTVEEGRIFRFELRRGVRFSDGEPFDADDVVFTFRALLDPAVGSPQREHLLIDDEPIEIRKVDSHTVEAELPTAVASGVEIFDSVAILPEHKLAEAYREGRLGDIWGLGTDPSDLVGLGPFRVRTYLSGERLELERNPHYWRQDAAGNDLPYLDGLVFSYVVDDEAQVLRFVAGESHLIEGVSGDNFVELEQRSQVPGQSFEMWNAGPGLAYEFIFFNLNAEASESHPELREKQTWFRSADFRSGLSLAIDRQAIARLAYRGLATPIAGPITPANRRWHDPSTQASPVDTQAAMTALARGGFLRQGNGKVNENGDEDGPLLAPSGTPVSLTLVTNSSNPQRTQTAAIIQEDLRRIGIDLKVVALDFSAMLDRVYTTLDYELCLLGLGRGAIDPNAAAAILRSDGDTHLWNLAEKEPLEPWQAELDGLLDQQRVELDPAERLRLVHRAQGLVSTHAPTVFLVAPNVLVGAHRNLANISPVALEPAVLWNSERLFWRSSESP